MDGRYSSVMAFILTVEKNLFFWALGITFFFSISVVAVVSKGREWYELVAMFFVIYIVSLLMASLIFDAVIGLPFARLETVTVP